MNWLYYLLEANLYLVIFYGFYRLFLHHDTFYGLNRYYLIFSSILAFALPFFQLGFLKKEVVISYATFTGTPETPSLFTLENGLLLLYATISLVLILKICLGLRNLQSIISKAKKTKENGIILIEIENSKMAFSFFNFLFIDPELDQKTTILKHEMVHIRQKHSLDILLFELIQISSWFNPITYLIKNDIKLIHEYLADEVTTNKDIAKYEYAIFLIQNSYGNQKVSLTNHFFNSSLLKNRISMLNQKKSAKWARLKLLFILPLTGLMLCLSTMAFTKDYGTIQFGQKKENLAIVFQDTTKKKVGKKSLQPSPPKESGQTKSKKVKEITINEPLIIADHKKLPPPPAPGPLKSKKPGQPKVNEVRFPLPIVKKDKKDMPAPPPPPVEPKAAKSGNGSETITGVVVINDNNKAQSVTSTSPSEQKELKPVTVVGYQSTVNKSTIPVKKVKGTKIEEVIVVGQPSKKQ